MPAAATLIALGLDADQAVQAPQRWLQALPAGAPLAVAALPKAGTPAGSVAGKPVRVGQLFTTADSGNRFYVMTAAGIAPVSATEEALLAARPGAPAPRRVSAADLAAAPVVGSGLAGFQSGDVPDGRAGISVEGVDRVVFGGDDEKVVSAAARDGDC